MKKGKFVLVSLFFLFTPLLFGDNVIEPTNAPQFFVASCCCIVVVIFFLQRSKEIILPNLLLSAVLLVFYFVYLISILWSLNVADAIFESQKLFLGLTGLIIFLNMFNLEDEHQGLFKSMIVVTLCYGIFSLVEFYIFGVLDLNKPTTFSSLAGHKNLLSSFVFLLLPFSVFGVFSFKGFWRILACLAILVILCVIGFLQTRSVYLALAVSVVVFFLMYFTASWKKKNRIFLFVLSLFIGLFTAGFLLKKASESDINKTVINASLNERFQLWNNTFKLVEENPLLGVGVGNWQYNYSKFSVEQIDAALYYQTVFKSPHNDFLSVLAETGLLGFSLLLLFIILVARKSITKILEEKNLKLILIFSTLTGLMTDAFFSFPKDRVAHVLLVALLVALLMVSTNLTSRVNQKGFLVKVFLLVGLSFNLLVGWKRMSGEYYTLKVLEAQRSFNPRAVIENGYKALSVFYTTDPTCTPIYTYIGWGYNTITDLDSLLVMNERAYELSPFDYKVLSNYGYSLVRLHQINTAEKVLLEAYRINPNYELTLLNLSVLEYNRGHYTESLKWLMLIGDYENKYATSVQRLHEKINE